MPTTANKFTSLFLSALAILCSSCGQQVNDRPPLATVQGVVTLDGKPFEGGFITFIPENGRPSVGTSDANGKYTLEYLKDVPGAAIGKHQVRIVTMSTGDENSNVKEKLPAKYHSNSTLAAEVTEGSNTINFDLKSN